jgi:Peptidase family M48
VRRAALALFAFAAVAARAADYSSLYDDALLRRKAPLYQEGLTHNFEKVFLPKMTPAERQAVSRVAIRVPLRGVERSPFEFYSMRDGTVTMPAMSIRFLADLAVAYVWLEANGYSMEPVADYVSMLKYQSAARFGGRYPDPRRALGIPADAERDPNVDKISLDLFNQSLMFTLLHEAGHVRYAHPGYGPGVSRAAARANEEQADRFALEIMRRAGQPIPGLLFFFVSMAHFVPHRADFDSQPEYDAFLAQATHPLTSDRVRTMSAFIRAHAADFARLQNDPALATRSIQKVADDIDGAVVPVLADVDQQRLAAVRGRSATLAGLQPRRPGELLAPERPSATGQFDGTYDGVFTSGRSSIPIRIVLQRRGETVTGRYSYGASEGEITGAVEDGVLRYTWREPGAEGRGVARATADGAGMNGTWGYGGASVGGGRWTGKRARR